MRGIRKLWLASLLIGAGSSAEPALSVREIPPNAGYRGLQYEVRWRTPQRELRFVLWPHERVSSDERGRFVERSDVVELRETEARTSWGIATEKLPELTLHTRLELHGDELLLHYALENLADEPRYLAVAPCLQLPGDWGDGSGWQRAKRAFVFAPDGLRWISDTAQRRGRVHEVGGPDPPRSPWSQHFLPRRSDEATLRDSPLALFGVAAQPVTASWIGASAPSGPLHVLAASSVDAGVTYALLDCLHAGVGVALGPHERRHVELRLYFHAGSLQPLLSRAARELGQPRPRPAPDFVSPNASPQLLASFEGGVEGWSASGAGAHLVSAVDPSPWFAATHGSRRLRATLAPGETLVSPWFDAHQASAREAWLALDVASPTAEGSAVELEIELASGERLVTHKPLADGKYRRLVIPLPSAARDRLRVHLRRDATAAPADLLLDAVTLFVL